MHNALRRTLVLLLALAMLLTSLPIIALAADKGTTFTYSQGDIIGLGSYPQTEVTDETLKSKLTNKAGSTDKWTSYNYYINSEQSDFMKYKDVELDGEKYRGVYFTSYRPLWTGGDGEWGYQDDNGYNTSTIYWFKYEPILWQILSYDATTDTAVVLSKSTIDAQEYYDNTDERTIDGKTIYANNYEHSNIRTWLNNTFYNTAFTSTEKSAIVATTLDNSACSTDYSQYDSNSTTDNVWLLSYAEAQNADYGFTTDYYDTETRQAKTTDYAKSQGIYVDNENKCTYWRLRSAGRSDYSACYVGSDGYVHDYIFDVNFSGGGVRPALTLHLKSEIVPSCAHTFALETVSPTCEQGGYDQYRCTKCDMVVGKENCTLPEGHTFTGEARVDSNGKNVYRCTVCNEFAVPSSGDTYKAFGEYPQSEVTDEKIKSALTEKAGSTDTWTSYEYYLDSEQSDFMKYTDVELDGEKYRGVYFTSYRPSWTDGDGEENHQEDNGYLLSTIYWFKFEPIAWKILSYDAEKETAVVISKFVIDSQEFYDKSYNRTLSDDTTVYPNNYEYSNIRTWLNDDFYNTAFSDTEKSAIIATALDNSAYSTYYSEYDSNSTTDNVWLLNYSDAQSTDFGFTDYVLDALGNRKATGTNYAKSQGLYVDEDNKCSFWRLSTAGEYSDFACIVDEDGTIYTYYGVFSTVIGVRPALTINIKADIASTAEDVVAKAEDTKLGKTTDNKQVIITSANTASTCLSEINGVELTDKDGKAVDSTKPLATGMKITLPSGDSVEIAVLGDIDSNGEVNVADARLALRAAVKLDTLKGVYEVAAKVGHDQISVSEARLILRAAVKLDNPKDWLK